MKEMTYKVKADGWKGTVVINMPSYKEKLAILKEMKIKVGANGAEAVDDPMEFAERLFEKAESMVKSVDLSFGGEKFKDLDSLGYYAEGQAVLNELQGILTQGISLGKGSAKG